MALAFALGALVLFSLASWSTFWLVRNQLVSEAESQHRQQTYSNYDIIQQRVLPVLTAPAPAGVDQELTDEAQAEAEEARANRFEAVFEDLVVTNGARSLLIEPNGRARSPDLLTRRDIPAGFEVLVRSGDVPVAQMRYQASEGMTYVVGVKLPDVEAAYYETLSLSELEATLGSLRFILFGVTAVSSVAGALLGSYTARRTLAPLPRISTAARAIAAGDLSTKIDLQTDPDLAVLTSAFNDMVDAVRERIAREQRFTSNVSHELRSPLMTLTASVEVLERRKESLPDVAQQAVELLSHDLIRFQRLVEDLLEISRMEAGAVQLQYSRFLLAEFLENVIFQSRSPHLELSHKSDDADLTITADKRRLAQVMTNLIDNAEKYGDGATGIFYERSGDRVQIVVDDGGPGVAPSERQQIFERFGRIDTTAGNRSKATGFGLGLSLVREHVRLHEGSVWVTDRIDGQRGARFVVELPLGDDIDLPEDLAE